MTLMLTRAEVEKKISYPPAKRPGAKLPSLRCDLSLKVLTEYRSAVREEKRAVPVAAMELVATSKTAAAAPSAGRVYDEGVKLMQQGQIEDAVSLVLEAVRMGLDTHDVYTTLGDLYKQKGNPEQAVLYYTKSLEAAPGDCLSGEWGSVRLFRERAECYAAMAADDDSAIARAAAEYDKYLLIAPAQYDALLLAGKAHLDAGNLERAKELLLDAEARDGADPYLQFNLGELYERLADVRLAKQHFSRAVQLDPEFPTPYIVQAESFIEKGDPASLMAALNLLLSVLKLRPMSGPIHIRIADVYAAIGDEYVESTKAMLTRGLELDLPEDAMASSYLRRGTLHGRDGDLERAISDYTMCLAVAPACFDALEKRAASFLARAADGDGRAAAADYEAVVALGDGTGDPAAAAAPPPPARLAQPFFYLAEWYFTHRFPGEAVGAGGAVDAETSVVTANGRRAHYGSQLVRAASCYAHARVCGLDLAAFTPEVTDRMMVAMSVKAGYFLCVGGEGGGGSSPDQQQAAPAAVVDAAAAAAPDGAEGAAPVSAPPSRPSSASAAPFTLTEDTSNKVSPLTLKLLEDYYLEKKQLETLQKPDSSAMEVMCRDELTGEELPQEVSATATAAELLSSVCTLFERKELDTALEVDKTIVCTAGGGHDVPLSSLALQADSRIVLRRSRERVMAIIAGWAKSRFGILPAWAWDDEPVVLAAVASNSRQLKFASARLAGSESFVRDVVRRQPLALEFASDALRGNAAVVLAAVERDADALKFAEGSFREDRAFMLTAAAANGSSLQHACEILRSDLGVVAAAVAQNGCALQYAGELVRADKEVVAAAVAQDGLALQYAGDLLRQDKDIVAAALNEDGRALQYAAESFRADRASVVAAVVQRGSALEYADAALRNDKDVVLSAAHNCTALPYASDALKDDAAFMLAAFAQSGERLRQAMELFAQYNKLILDAERDWSLVYSSADAGYGFTLAARTPDEDDEPGPPADVLVANDSDVLTAVNQHGCLLRCSGGFHLTSLGEFESPLEYASDALRAKAEVVLAAVAENGAALQHAAEPLRGEAEVAIAAVAQNGLALRYCSDALKGEKQVVLAAVRQHGYALQYASDALRQDADVALAAVRNGSALQFAGEALTTSKEFMLAAIAQNRFTVHHADESLLQDKDFVLAAEALMPQA